MGELFFGLVAEITPLLLTERQPMIEFRTKPVKQLIRAWAVFGMILNTDRLDDRYLFRRVGASRSPPFPTATGGHMFIMMNLFELRRCSGQGQH